MPPAEEHYTTYELEWQKKKKKIEPESDKFSQANYQFIDILNYTM